MVEPEAKSHVSLKEGLPWLKRLQGALDDDNSSDSSSYPPNITSVKAVEKKKKKKKKKPEKEGDGRRRVTKRQRQQPDNDSDDKSSEGSNVAKETQRRMLNKNDKTCTLVRRKRPYRAPKKEQSKESKKRNATISVADQATALREQRKQNLCMRRGITRENDNIALKLTQDESSRAIRLVRNEQTISAGKEVDIEANSERWKRLSLGLRCRRNSTDKFSTKCKLLKTTALSTKKTENEHVNHPIVVTGNSLDSLKQDGEDEVGHCFVAEATAAELTKHDGNEEELMTTPEPIEHDNHDEVFFAVTKNEMNELGKLDRNGEPESILSKSETAEINVIAKAETIEDAMKVVTLEKSEEAGAGQESFGTTLTPTVTSSDYVKHEVRDKMKEEPHVDVKAVPRLVKKEGNDERQAESHVFTQNGKRSVKSEDGAEKNSREAKRRDLVLEMMPIPRRRMKAGASTALSTTELFVIPKRLCGNSDKGAQTAVVQVSRTRTSEPHASIDKNSLGPPGFVDMLPLPSLGLSPKLPKVVDPIRPVLKQLKKPVPVKNNASICRQDQALMRLSRKRNSIFMAAVELAQAPDFRINTGRMMDYEVYDVEDKALPDLIPRLSCATKREMASNRESYAASFFGVSLSVPKAIEKANTAVNECGNNGLDIRKISCYEELRFKQSEDREYYQRRMYGTAFVPQKLRGWITLKVRNARFERKSTGIRFNQDRDREEFAASLSKRYTHNKSVPRCDIPRENWHKLMRNQSASVFLHYYNREDAEQASHIFRDDLGHPLELKLSLKAGVVIRASSFSAVEPSPQRIPRRSHSSERSVPESSPVSSQNGSPRKTASWQRERLPVSKSDNRYSRYGPPPSLPWSRSERQYDTFDGGSKWSRAMVESRPRSRSRSKSFHGRRNGFNAYERRSDQVCVKRNRTSPSAPDTRERTDSGNENLSSAVYSDADTLARKRARSSPRSPRRSTMIGLDTSKRELKIDNERRGQEEEEITRKSEINPVRTMSERDRRSGLHRARSPSRWWQQEPINTEASQRRDTVSKYSCARSRSPAARHRFDQQWSNRNMDKRRSRSRSRSRGGNHSDQYNLHQGSRGFERAGAYGDSTRERSMYTDRGRPDYDGRRGGSDLRPRQ